MQEIQAKLSRLQESLASRADDLDGEILQRVRRLAERVNSICDGSAAGADPDGPDAWHAELGLEHEVHNLGNELYQRGCYGEAVQCYDIALALRPDLLETYFNRGLAFTRQSMYDKAIVDLTKVVELNRNLAEAWYTRGLVWEYQHQYAKAIDDYQQALEVDEGYEKARQQLAVARQKKIEFERGESEDDEDRQHEAARRQRAQRAREVQEALERCATLRGSADEQETSWRRSKEREKVIDYLNQYGRVLTAVTLKSRNLVGADKIIRSLVRTLSKMKRRSAILVGHAGTGKSAVIQELAYRMVHGHPSIPARLRDCDVFEISPVFLHADTKYRGEYEEKIRDLVKILQKSPQVVLFIDEIHSFFQSGIHEEDSSFTRANQIFKKVLADGEITCIGCTTPSEYRHYVEPDAALARRFSTIRLEPPSRQATVGILSARRPRMEKYYAPLRIPDEILQRVVQWTEDCLPGRHQPDKSIQLLDEACAFCATEQPPVEEVTEEVLLQALEDMVGRSIARTQLLTEDELFGRLRKKVIGQDEILRGIARAVIAGLGEWTERSGPRGVFLFGGPTGVGKTETAVTLAEILGGGRDALVRVDCNTLQGPGHDSMGVIHRLLGVPPGLVGYARGQGGILSRVRDLPESIVLFDEFEKADPGVGKLLLQVIDDGRVEDTDGSLLDFRRSFIIFTTNAGSIYDRDHEIGFIRDQDSHRPHVDSDELKAALREVGMGEEFLGRISHTFLFQGLAKGSIQRILEAKLSEVRETAELRQLDLTWEPEIIPYLASQWQPRYGVRHLTTILRNRIVEHLNLADAQGELHGVGQIRLEVAKGQPDRTSPDRIGPASRQRRESALVISLG